MDVTSDNTSDIASRLSVEVWELILSHLHPHNDKKSLYSCLTVSKCISNALTGFVLYRQIVITNYQQIALLVFHLLAYPTKQRLVKYLEFQLDKDTTPDHLENVEIHLAPIPYLIQLVPTLRQLHNLPLFLKVRYLITPAVNNLEELSTIGISYPTSATLAAVCGLWESSNLPRRNVRSLYISYFPNVRIFMPL